jgi:hypothetical protein
LALHYYLTGWLPSKETAIGLGQWVIDMDDGARTPFRWLARGATGLASASGDASYHGPGRGPGNSINALIVAFELSGERRFLDKAEDLIRRCVSPDEDLEALTLLHAERRWYYTVFLDALGRYLWLKQQIGELDGVYEYARRTLLHYASWMCGHEFPYLDKPEILDFPTETWSAQDIRKSDVLAWAALCGGPEERPQFLAASERFFEDVMTRLPSLPTWQFTRPVVLLLWRGYALGWVLEHPAFRLPESSAVPPARARRFVPQKAIALRRAKAIVAGGAIVLVLLLAALWFSLA